ncbi:hypothetical protein BaRGS_00014270 [Batillaria attramentaria]|uniref:Uncharacterized protein n=1 Tax=Batillaria attramentaria TaxID=370345 RepID=A0ABD0L4B7_9CAEN
MLKYVFDNTLQREAQMGSCDHLTLFVCGPQGCFGRQAGVRGSTTAYDSDEQHCPAPSVTDSSALYISVQTRLCSVSCLLCRESKYICHRKPPSARMGVSGIRVRRLP